MCCSYSPHTRRFEIAQTGAYSGVSVPRSVESAANSRHLHQPGNTSPMCACASTSGAIYWFSIETGSVVDGLSIMSCSAAIFANSSGGRVMGSSPGLTEILRKKESSPFFSFGMVANTSTRGSSAVFAEVRFRPKAAILDIPGQLAVWAA